MFIHLFDFLKTLGEYFFPLVVLEPPMIYFNEWLVVREASFGIFVI